MDSKWPNQPTLFFFFFLNNFFYLKKKKKNNLHRACLTLLPQQSVLYFLLNINRWYHIPLPPSVLFFLSYDKLTSNKQAYSISAPTPFPIKGLLDPFLPRREGEMETCLRCMITIIFIRQKENRKPFNKQMQRNIRHMCVSLHTHTQRPLERKMQKYI